MSVEILQTHKLLDSCQAALAKNFTVHKLFEAEDREALLASVAPRIRGIAIAYTANKIDGAFMSRFPKLEIVSSFGVGYDHVDAAEAGRRGLVVTNTPDVLTDDVADLAVGLVIALLRQLPRADRFVRDGQQARLTQAALETLAVVAYRQPVTRGRISAIRGVNVDGVVRTLLSRGLVEEVGEQDESGAHLYRTTSYFLERLGLTSLEQLPPLADYLPDVDSATDFDELAR